MAKSNNHKLALLYMMRELFEHTDEDHAMNATDLIRALEKYDCDADRRTIYSNVAILQDFAGHGGRSTRHVLFGDGLITGHDHFLERGAARHGDVLLNEGVASLDGHDGLVHALPNHVHKVAPTCNQVVKFTDIYCFAHSNSS